MRLTVLFLVCALLVTAQAVAQPVAARCASYEVAWSVEHGTTYRCVPVRAHRLVTVDHGLFWAGGVLATMDLAQTMYCVGARRCQEANPIMRPLVQRPMLFGAAKGAFNVAIIGTLHHYRRSHPTAVLIGATAYLVLNGLVVVHNWRVMR